MISGVSIVTVPTIALPLNIAVSGIAFFNYFRAGHFSLKFSLPFLLSIPFSFYAGTLNFDESTLAIVFVIALLASSFALFTSSYSIKKRQEQINSRDIDPRKITLLGLPIGAVLGSKNCKGIVLRTAHGVALVIASTDKRMLPENILVRIGHLGRTIRLE